MNWQTINTDLNWWVRNVTDIVVYYPPGEYISKGVSDESTFGFVNVGTDVFVIDKGKRKSPFMSIASKYFTDEEEFFEFYEKHMKDKMGRLRR